MTKLKSKNLSIIKIMFSSVIALLSMSNMLQATEIILSPAQSLWPAYNNYFDNISDTSSDGLNNKRSEAVPYAIQSLARSLGSDRTVEISDSEYRTRVFEYVRDNIKTTFEFGLRKGALGAYFDNAGTSFDQAQLMVELLRQRTNMTASYKIGNIAITAAQWADLSDVTDAAAACMLLRDGGNPILVNGTATCHLTTGNVSTINILGAWVYSGTSSYDPSYKKHSMETGIDVGDAVVSGAGTYSESTFWTAASTDTATSNGVLEIYGSDITGTGGIEAKLEDYATDLVTEFKDVEYKKSLAQIAGGRYVDPADQVSIGSRTLITYGTLNGDVADKYRTAIRIQYNGIDHTLYADELYGLRLWIDNSGTYDKLMAGSADIATATSSGGDMTISIDHPYAASSGAYGDHSVTISNSDIDTSAIIVALGSYSPQMARLMMDDSYQQSITSGSNVPDTETMARLALGANWAIQYGQLMDLESALGDATIHHHDTIGVITSDVNHNIATDLRTNISVIADNGLGDDRDASIHTLNTASGVLKSALINQPRYLSSDDIRTTHSMFAETIAEGRKIYEFTNSNYSSIDSLVGGTDEYSSALRTDIKNDLQNNANIVYLMVEDLELLDGYADAEPFLRYGGASYEDYFETLIGDSIGVYGDGDGMEDAGDLLGGNAGDIIRDISPQSVSGEYGDSVTDLVTGAGGFPMALPFTRSFQQSRIDAPDKGWMHNYDITARTTSNPTLALTNPIGASQAIATLHVLREMYKAENSDLSKRIVTGILVADWFRKQLTNNTFTIRTAGGSDFFYKLADGTYHALSGSLAELSYNSTADEYTLTAISGSDMTFENPDSGINNVGHYRIKEMTWPNGLDVDFTYTSGTDDTLKVENNVGRDLLITDTGGDGDIDYVDDNAGRRVNFTYHGTTGYLYKSELKAQTSAAQTKYGMGTELLWQIDHSWVSANDEWEIKKFIPTDTVNAVVTHTLNRLGQMVESKDRENNINEFYAAQRRGEVVDANGGVTTTLNNHQGLPYKVTNALGLTSTSEYYDSGLLYRAITPQGNAVSYDYDKYGNTIWQKTHPNDGLGGTDWDVADEIKTEYFYCDATTGTYCTADNPTLLYKTTDELGRSTFITYDSAGFPTKTTLPNISVYDVDLETSSTETPETLISYVNVTAAGGGTLKLPEIVTDAAGTETKTEYYNTGLVKKVTQDYHSNLLSGLNIKQSYTYDDLGNQYSGVNHRNNEKKTTFNLRRQVSQTINDFEDEVTWAWSGGSWTSSVTDVLDVGKVTHEFDDAGRPIKSSAFFDTGVNDYLKGETVYDTMGRVSKSKDHAGNESTINYTPVLTTTITVTKPSTVSASNILASHTGVSKVETIDAAGRKTHVYSDILGRAIRTDLAPGTLDAATEEQGYYENGMLAWVKDGNGNVTEYTYDTYGRAKKTIYPDNGGASDHDFQEVTTRDAIGRVTKLTHRDGSTVELTYDAHNRITQRLVKNSLSVTDATYTFKFDILGNTVYAKVVRGSDTHIITSKYDALSRILEEESPFSSSSDFVGVIYDYDDLNGEHDIIYHYDGTASNTYTLQYNGFGQVSTLRGVGGSVRANYTYDDMGRMTEVEYSNFQKINYSYFGPSETATGQLPGALKQVENTAGPNPTFDYGYDTTGKVTAKTVTPTIYQWTPAADATIDSTLNALNQVTDDDIYGTNYDYDDRGNMIEQGTRDLTWSVENYLLEVKDGATTLGTYKYDAMGRRIQKTAGGTTTRYLYAGGNVVAELDSNNDHIRRYAYGPGVDRPALTNDGTSGGIEYYHYDGQGNVIALSDNTGGASENYIYDPYGKTETNTGNVYRHKGRRLDFETGYYYYRARYYDPEIGRFLSADPIGYGDGLNMYAFVGNDPMNYRDPSGTDFCADNPNTCESQEQAWNQLVSNPWASAGQALGAVGSPSMNVDEAAFVAAKNSGDPRALARLRARYNNMGGLSYSADYSGSFAEAGLSTWVLTGRVESERIHNLLVEARDARIFNEIILQLLAYAKANQIIDGALSPAQWVRPRPGTPGSVPIPPPPEWLRKIERQLEGIFRRADGPHTILYKLVARDAGIYPCVGVFKCAGLGNGTGKIVTTGWLDAGGVWRIGVTSQIPPKSRYPEKFYTGLNVTMMEIDNGTQKQMLYLEKLMLVQYFFTHGMLPLGNPIFR